PRKEGERKQHERAGPRSGHEKKASENNMSEPGREAATKRRRATTIMTCVRFAIAAVIGCSASPPPVPDELEVPTDAGTVRGSRAANVRSFPAPPCAAPPVAANRFRAPQSPEAWNGVHDATAVGAMCPQGPSLGPGGGDEDCLYLNVFTPSPAP